MWVQCLTPKLSPETCNLPRLRESVDNYGMVSFSPNLFEVVTILGSVASIAGLVIALRNVGRK